MKQANTELSQVGVWSLTESLSLEEPESSRALLLTIRQFVLGAKQKGGVITLWELRESA